MAKGSMKVAVSGPEATPPESKAMAVKVRGTKKLRAMATRYPGMRKYRMGQPVMTRSMARPLAADTAMDRLSPMAFAEMAPALSSSTCLLRTCTAGSALMMNQPMTMAKGISSQRYRSASAPPST